MRSIHDKRNRDTVKALLQGGANVNQAVRDVTPLLYAITQCSLYDKRGFDTVKTLLQGGAKVNEYGKTSGQWASPLIKAIEMQVRLVYACFADCRTVYSVSFLMCMYACALLHSCRTLYKS
jgi:ankyrin repeat protein